MKTSSETPPLQHTIRPVHIIAYFPESHKVKSGCIQSLSGNPELIQASVKTFKKQACHKPCRCEGKVDITVHCKLSRIVPGTDPKQGIHQEAADVFNAVNKQHPDQPPDPPWQMSNPIVDPFKKYGTSVNKKHPDTGTPGKLVVALEQGTEPRPYDFNSPAGKAI